MSSTVDSDENIHQLFERIRGLLRKIHPDKPITDDTLIEHLRDIMVEFPIDVDIEPQQEDE